MTFNDAQIACHRFGLGARPDELVQIIKIGAKKYLLAQLDQYNPKPQPIATQPHSSQLLATEGEMRRRLDKLKTPAEKQQIRASARRQMHRVYEQNILARHQQAVHTEQSFTERLVYFWQNHFAVSAQKQRIHHLVGCFENEAIRPHIMGNFADILLASTQHPAMQVYLDNFKSIGPDSKAGKKRNKGLNENLAREILELHTLGVHGGYTQNDVIALANMLTGWGLDYQKKPGFRFNKNAHQNQPTHFLGKTYQQTGIKQAKAALNHLATHKNTGKFIAQKLAHHFAGSHNPQLTQNLITQLENSYAKTTGELKPLYRILINHPACWQAEALRFRTPNEWFISCSRSFGEIEIKPKKLIALFRNMGQQPYFVSSPAGWPDNDEYWNSSAALIQKWQYAKRLIKYIKPNVKQFSEICLGDHIDEHTILAMQKAERKREKLTLFLLSQQMQYR